jgi:hypothetical protein
MALDFPSEPILNQIFIDWRWDGSKWVRRAAGGVARGPQPADPFTGDLWYDNVVLRVWDGVSWQDAGGAVSFGPSPPPTPSDGILWWDTNQGRLYISDGGLWIGASQPAGGSGGGGASVDVGDTQPSEPLPGHLWWNTDEQLLYVYDGEDWKTAGQGPQGEIGPQGPAYTTVTVGDTATSAPGDPANVELDPASDDQNVILNFTIPRGAEGPAGESGLAYVGDTAPSPASEGMLWFNSDDSRLYIHSGGVWGAISSGDGSGGGPGAPGLSSFSPSTANFIVPAIGGSVPITLTQAEWCKVDAPIFVGGMSGVIRSVLGNTILVERTSAYEVPAPPGPPIVTGNAPIMLSAANGIPVITGDPPSLTRIGTSVFITYSGANKNTTTANTISMVEIPPGFQPINNVASPSGAMTSGTTAQTMNIQRYTSGTNVFPNAPGSNITTGNTRWSLRHTNNTAIAANAVLTFSWQWQTADVMPS